MGDDEKVLSQADVDALVALVPDTPRPPAAAGPEPVAAEPPPPPEIRETVAPDRTDYEPAVPQAAPPGELAALQKTVADLSGKVNRLTGAVQRLNLLEERIDQLELSGRQPPHEIQPLKEEIIGISSQLRDLSLNTKNKWDLHEEFQCEKCKSKRTVAFLVKCTSCGSERWFGWWPPKKTNGANHTRKP